MLILREKRVFGRQDHRRRDAPVQLVEDEVRRQPELDGEGARDIHGSSLMMGDWASALAAAALTRAAGVGVATSDGCFRMPAR